MSRACIPFHILFDKDLSNNELKIYGLIEHMESNNKPAFFNNRTIAGKLGVSHESRIVGKMLKKLIEKNYITRQEKELTFIKDGKEIKAIRSVFNTVKSTVVFTEEDQPPVSEVPPLTGVAEIPPPPVSEVPPYKLPLDLTLPLTTTTEAVVVISKEKDKELLLLRNIHLSKDTRSNDEFLSQCKWHLDKGSKSHTEAQRYVGLKKIISSGQFDIPAGYGSPKKTAQVSEDYLRNQYKHYCNSWIEQDLRSKGFKTKTYEEWMLTNA